MTSIDGERLCNRITWKAFHDVFSARFGSRSVVCDNQIFDFFLRPASAEVSNLKLFSHHVWCVWCPKAREWLFFLSNGIFKTISDKFFVQSCFVNLQCCVDDSRLIFFFFALHNWRETCLTMFANNDQLFVFFIFLLAPSRDKKLFVNSRRVDKFA